MVYESCGEIIQSNCDIICIYLNRDSIISGKMFKHIKEKYPEVIEKFKDMRKETIHKKRVGNHYMISADDGTIFVFINVNTNINSLYSKRQKELISRVFYRIINKATKRGIPLTIGMQKLLPNVFKESKNFVIMASLIEDVFASAYVEVFLIRPNGRL